MSSITRIRDLAASSGAALPDAILQCLILADQLDYAPLSVWSNNELEGYADVERIPEYRVIQSELHGRYREPQYQPYSRSVPDVFIPKEIRGEVQKIWVVNSLTTLLTLPDDGSVVKSVLHQGWLVGRINSAIKEMQDPYGFCHYTEVWAPYRPGAIAGILGTVRTRVIKFMLELNKLFPSDSAIEEEGPKLTEQIEEKFRTIVYINNISNSSNVVVAGEGSMVSQSNATVVSGHFGSLVDYLKANGVSDEAVEALEPIAEEIKDGEISEGTKQAFETWIGEAADKTGQALGEVATDSAKRAATETILKGMKEFAPKALDWLSSLYMPDIPLM